MATPRIICMALLFGAWCVLSMAVGALAQDDGVAGLSYADAGPAGTAPADTNALLAPDELEDLLKPIALYPDVLLAQILPAATYPLEIVEAVRFLQARPDMALVDQQRWDPSIKALARYPQVLAKLNDDLEWTNAVGMAFLNQPHDVMDAIQRLRAEAAAAGTLRSGPQIAVVREPTEIRIVSPDPDVVYIPTYDPTIAYSSSSVVLSTPLIQFSAGFGVGGWLFADCDWIHRDVYYCQPGYWGGWVARPTFALRGERWGVVGDLWRRAEITGHDVVWHRRDDSSRPHFYGRFAQVGAGSRVGDVYFRGHETAQFDSNLRRGVGARQVPPAPVDRPLIGGPSRTEIKRPIGGNPTPTRIVGQRRSYVTRGGPPPNRPTTAFNRTAPAHATEVISQRGQTSRGLAGHGGSPSAPRAPNAVRTAPSTPRPSVFHAGDSSKVQSASQRGAISRTVAKKPEPRKP